MRVVLTGATGFIGLAIARCLLSKGYQVCALIRPDSRFSLLQEHSSIQLIEYTSLKDQSVQSQLKSWRPDVMLHLAWKGVTGGERNQAFQFSENITFTLDCVHLASEAGCKQWIGMGSQAEYGVANRRVSEDSFCKPVTAYGKAKLATGIAALGMCEALNIRGAWCRIFSVYGPGDHPQTFISYVADKLSHKQSPELTACEQKWDYLYISDAAKAVVSIAEAGCQGVFNIGSGSTVTLKEVVEFIKQATGYAETVNYGLKSYGPNQIMHLEADVSRLLQATTWRPKVTLERGLLNTIQSIQYRTIHEGI